MKINGMKLADARVEARKTRAELAAAAGLTHGRIWQIETESESNVNEHIVEAMCRFVGARVGDVAVKE